MASMSGTHSYWHLVHLAAAVGIWHRGHVRSSDVMTKYTLHPGHHARGGAGVRFGGRGTGWG